MGIAHAFLVPAKMEETRRAEDLRRVTDDILHDLVVRRRGDHAMVDLEPLVMRGGEVELRDRLQPHLAELLKLGLHPVRRPASLHGQLGMARELHELAEIQHHHVHLLFGHPGDSLVPDCLVEADVVRHILAPIRLLDLVGHLPIAPHVAAGMQQHGMDLALAVRRLD